jgi:flagellar biosynthetic protein FliP
MAPVFNEVNQQALQPYLNEQKAGAEALASAERPMRIFMLAQTRDTDLALFSRLSGRAEIASEDEVPFSVLLPAFATSELKTAFQIGFLLFIPFLVIDLVVASILMSMGMMMLSPVIISLPFKIMLFVLVDGWSLVMSTLASSFLN